MFGNQLQGCIFVGTNADALPISVDDPLMTILDCSRAGFDASTFSGHSRRAGFLTSAGGRVHPIFKMIGRFPP